MPGPGRPRKEKSPPEDRLFKLSMRDYMEKQNLLAHALSVQNDMTSNQLQASVQQMQVISEAMTQLQSSTKAVLEANGIGENYDMFDSLPAISRLLKQDKTLIGNPLGASLGQLSMFSKAGPSVKEKRKRNRKPKHPDAPKQPITAYFLFLEANRERIRAELPADTPAGDIQKRGTELWNDLPNDEKEVYKAAYRENFKKYKEDMKQFSDFDGLAAEAPRTKSNGAGAGAAAAGQDDSDNSDSSSDSDNSDAAPAAAGGEATAVPQPQPPPAPPVGSVQSKPAAPAKGRKNVPSNLIDPALTSTTPVPTPPPAAEVPAPAKEKRGSKEGKKHKEQTPKGDSPEESKKKKRKGDDSEKADKKRKRKETYGDDY